MSSDEKMLFNNIFGSVTDKRIILNFKNGSEDIPVSKITSVAYKHKRNYFQSIGGFVAAFVILVVMISTIERITGGAVLFMVLLIIFLLLSGIANWIGHHQIIIAINGSNRKSLKAEMAKTREGRAFVDAIRKAMI